MPKIKVKRKSSEYEIKVSHSDLIKIFNKAGYKIPKGAVFITTAYGSQSDESIEILPGRNDADLTIEWTDNPDGYFNDEEND